MKITRWFLCALGFHKYRIEDCFRHGLYKLGCKHCSKKWGYTTSHRTRLKWDLELEEIAQEIGRK